MFVKKDNNEWDADYNILDGKLTKIENGVEVEMASVKVSWTQTTYIKRDGLSVSRKYRSTYLPANIILLRQ